MNYTQKDFYECSLNPLKEGVMLEIYPQLQDIVSDEWRDEYLDAILRFIIMVYDPKSPLFKAHRDLHQRKTSAIAICGFNITSKATQGVISEILTIKHRYFVGLLIEFLKHFVKVKEFAAIVIVENCFWESCDQLMKPISGDNSKVILEAVQKKSAIKDELDKDIARLEKYYKSFFGDDDEVLEVVKGRMTPENLAMSSLKRG